MEDTTDKLNHDVDTVMYGTTKDDVDAGQTMNKMVQEADMTAEMTPTMTSGYDQPMIKDFLAKPVIIDTIRLEAGEILDRKYALNSYLHEGTLPNDIWWDKIKGYYGIRGTFVIRVNVNAQKFQAGRLLMTHEPMYYDMVHSSGTSSAFDRTSALTTATQLPRVELDIPTTSEMVMRIPYKSLAAYYNILDGTGTWGRVSLREYLPLNVAPGAQSVINMVVFLSMEDVELSAPTLPQTIYPQVTFQMSDPEKKVGPFEQGMAITGKVAMLGSTIPYVKTVAKPLAWVANIGEKVCSMFGWSKPINTMAIQRFNNTLMQYQSNNSGLDNAFNMGLAIDNEVECIPSFGGTYLDESSLGYIKTRSAFYRQWEWQSTLATGDLFGSTLDESSILLRPTEFYFDTAVNEFNLTPVAGLANVFHNWRGGLRFKFKFARTEYHSGRMAVSFYPANLNTVVGADTTPLSVSFDDTQFLQREILDLRNAYEFEFTVPFTANVPYLNVNQPMGRLVLQVVNPLVTNDMAPSDISFAVEVSGAEDLEFFGPREPTYFPIGQTIDQGEQTDFRAGLENDSFCGAEIITADASNYTLKCAYNVARPSVLLGSTVFLYISGQDFTFDVGTQFIILPTRIVQATEDPLANLSNAGIFAYDGSGRVMIYQDQLGKFYLQPITIQVGPTATFQMEDAVRSERMIGATKSSGPMTVEYSKQCVGEQILSLKQLALRTVYNTPVGTEFLSNGDIVQPIAQRPHGIFQNRQTGLELGFTDFYSYVASCFAFARGGTILRYQVNSFKRAQIVYDDSKAAVGPFDNQDDGHNGYVVEKSGNIIALYVPQYANTIGRLVTRQRGNDVGSGRPFGQTSRIIFTELSGTGTPDDSNLRIGRSAADDTQFGFFLGFPPMSTYIRKTPA